MKKNKKKLNFIIKCRDAITGRYVTFKETLIRPETTIVEKIRHK